MNDLLRWVAVIAMLAFAARARAAVAQDADTTDAQAWNVDVISKLSASQAGYRNWSEGGVRTVAATAGVSGKAERTTDRWQQTYDARLAFGLVKQDTAQTRKSDDVIRLNAALQYLGDGFFRDFNPTVAFSARTQFAAGYNFDDNPFVDDGPVPVKVSDFLAPATLTETIGLTYDSSDWFSVRLGVAGKETIVRIARLRTVYGVPEGRPVRFEAGMESKAAFDHQIFENVTLKSSLVLFAAFNKAETPPDMLWENLIAMQVNKWLSVNLEAVSMYDRDVSDVIQLKEVLSLGISFVLI